MFDDLRKPYADPNAPAASGPADSVKQIPDTDTGGDAAQRRYRQLCNTANIPLFSQAWWLDATAGPGNWGVALVERGGQVVASLPYAPRRLYGFSVIAQPALAKMAAPWLAPMAGKPARMLGQKKELMDELIGQLPRFDHFQQHWDPSQTNWLPFAWKGFRQTTKYTYVLDDLSDTAALWNGMQHNIRGEIRKAGSRHGLQVRDDLGIDEFIQLNRQVFTRQRMPLPYTDDYVRRLDAACAARGARKIFIAVDKQGYRHAGVYLVWDGQVAYYLMAGSDPKLRTSGASSLCIWDAIRFASGVARTFGLRRFGAGAGRALLQGIRRQAAALLLCSEDPISHTSDLPVPAFAPQALRYDLDDIVQLPERQVLGNKDASPVPPDHLHSASTPQVQRRGIAIQKRQVFLDNLGQR